MEDIDRERERGDKAVKRVGENSGGLLRQTDRESYEMPRWSLLLL
jgi:hypothetical protein